jgi:hypothetical protein
MKSEWARESSFLVYSWAEHYCGKIDDQQILFHQIPIIFCQLQNIAAGVLHDFVTCRAKVFSTETRESIRT